MKAAGVTLAAAQADRRVLTAPPILANTFFAADVLNGMDTSTEYDDNSAKIHA